MLKNSDVVGPIEELRNPENFVLSWVVRHDEDSGHVDLAPSGSGEEASHMHTVLKRWIRLKNPEHQRASLA